MPVASGSGQPRYVPSRDERDRGNLPQELELLSYHLGKFLRHEAPKWRLCDNDDWVDVETTIVELEARHKLTVSKGDILQVVEGSYSKDRPRFEKWISPDGQHTMVRAANAEYYRTRGSKARNSRHGGSFRDDRSDCSDWSGWSGAGSTASHHHYAGRNGRGWRSRDYSDSYSTEAPSHFAASSSASTSRSPDNGAAWSYNGETAQASNSRRAGRDAPWPSYGEVTEAARHNGREPAASSSKPSEFDGVWCSKDGTSCRISGDMLFWEKPGHNFDPLKVRIRDREIFVPDRRLVIQGWLSEDGNSISFDDSDMWRRQIDGHPEAAEPTAAATEPAPAAAAAAAAAPAGDGAAAGAGSAAGASANASAAGGHCERLPPVAEGSEGDREDGQLGWVDMRVKEDWVATGWGSEYLSLRKGELLSVCPVHEAGWAYGHSLQSEKQGWFPPSYAYAES